MVRFQKWIKDIFLTPHGHSIHCQQWQLSKVLMSYREFVSHAYCGAAGPVSKMASQQEKAFCVPRFEVSRSAITVRPEFRARFNTRHHSCVVRLFQLVHETFEIRAKSIAVGKNLFRPTCYQPSEVLSLLPTLGSVIGWAIIQQASR
jgi:hypothetical protein